MRVQVPSAVVNNSYKAFPQGSFDGTISAAQVRDIKNDGSWVVIKLSLDKVTPREGTPNPGRDRFSGDITLVNTDREGNTVDLRQLTEINGDTPFSIERSAGLLAGLGAALGVAEVDDAGNVGVDFSQVAEALVDGQFAGQRIGFEVSHYTTSKNETRDQLATIGMAA